MGLTAIFSGGEDAVGGVRQQLVHVKSLPRWGLWPKVLAEALAAEDDGDEYIVCSMSAESLCGGISAGQPATPGARA